MAKYILKKEYERLEDEDEIISTGDTFLECIENIYNNNYSFGHLLNKWLANKEKTGLIIIVVNMIICMFISAITYKVLEYINK